MKPTPTLLKRSVWKGPYIVPLALGRPAVPGQRMPPIRTQARSCVIIPDFVGRTFEIHNGKTYTPLTVTEDMVGHKLGEFAFTRKVFVFKMSNRK